jgi:DICT domain-containing protein
VELARTARVAVVFAEMSSPRETSPRLPIEVALPHEAPLNREWIVVCDAPDLPACMVAVERPGQDAVPDARRRYEAVWTVDPRAVRHASRVASELAREYRPELSATGLAVPADEPPDSSADLRRASGLLTRTMGYLDARR